MTGRRAPVNPATRPLYNAKANMPARIRGTTEGKGRMPTAEDPQQTFSSYNANPNDQLPKGLIPAEGC